MKDNDARKFSDIFLRSRYDAGKTQAYMAKAMDVSIKTVQNWESGITCPSQTQTFDWFVKLGVQPLPYYLDYLYPDLKKMSADSPVEDIDKALCEVIEQLSLPMKQRLLYILSGKHGSSVAALLELTAVYLTLPLHGRIVVTDIVLSKFKLDGMSNDLHTADTMPPDIDLILKAVERATNAMLDGKDNYTALPETRDEK